MAKGSNSTTGRRSSSHNTKPYDANNSFVKKVATKVTDLIPQRSWISKWFNTSQSDGEILDDTENPEEVESEEDIQKPPPLKRPCIRMDVTHPPGTFSIQPRTKSAVNKAKAAKQQYALHNETSDDICEPVSAGPSGMGRLISSTPAVETDVRNVPPQRSELNSLGAVSNNGTTNGTDDNSESSESTSGCSSLIPQTNRQEAPSNVSYSSPFSNRKRFNDDKLSFTNHLQSPRSSFLDSNSRDSLSSRRPSFNASVMSNTLDRASPLSSPFYSGNITFGGANAAGLYKRGRHLFNNSNEVQLKIPKRTNVEVKPSNTAGVDSSGMSQTAKKILEALEHFSSPITDAKRIPLKMTNNVTSSVSKKRAREETLPTARVGLRHLTRELTVPTVPDILKLRRRQKLQDTTVAARKIVAARSEPPPPQEYHLRTQVDEDSKHHGKLKATTKTDLDQEETIEAVNLPNIPLPISTLPNFNFTPSNIPIKTDKTLGSKEETFTFASPIKVTKITKTLKSINNFTFSSPISADKQSTNNSCDLHSPTNKSGGEYNPLAVSSAPTMVQNLMFRDTSGGSSTAPRPKTKSRDTTTSTASSELKSGSVMDILCPKLTKGKPEKSSGASVPMDLEKDSVDKKEDIVILDTKKNDNMSNTQHATSQNVVWECSECLIKNSDSETQCLTCKAPKPGFKSNETPELLPTSGNTTEVKSTSKDCFGSQFKLSSNQWECTSCLVKNKQTDVTCVACTALKPASKSEIETKPTSSDFSKLKPAEGSWECPGCMLRNSADCTTCPCCQASKPSLINTSSSKNKDTMEETRSLVSQKTSTTPDGASNSSLSSTLNMDKLKPNKDTWECPCCMVRNAVAENSCPCCNTAKPGAGIATKNIQSLPSNGFGDKFKKPQGAWTCDSCMVQNDEKVTECVACGGLKPGSKKLETTTTSTGSSLQFSFGMPPNAGGFKFGIDKADQQKSDTVAPLNGFIFGDTSQNTQAGQFTFGIQKEEKKKEETEPANSTSLTNNTSGSGFGFKINAYNDEKNNKTAQDLEKSEKKPVLPFSFGVPKSDGAAASNDKQAVGIASPAIPSGFTFGVIKPETKETNVNNAKQGSALDNSMIVASKPSPDNTQSITVTNASVLPSFTQNSSQEAKPVSTFSFGVPSSTVTVTTSGSAQTSVATTSLPSSIQSSFAFADSKPVEQTSTVPTFGQIQTSTPASGLTSTFTFGETKVADITQNSLAKTSTTLPSGTTGSSIFSSIPNTPSLFGNNEVKTTSTFGAEDNKLPAFGTNTSKPSAFVIPENKVPAFGSTENKPSIFGAPDTKIPVFTPTDKPTSVFTATPQSATAAPTPTFGASSATPSLFGSSVTPVFGSNTPSTFPAGSTQNIFSTAKPGETTTPNTNLFTFGTTPAQPVAQPEATFNFSANNNPTDATQKQQQQQLFTFGSTANAPQTGNLFGGNFGNTPAANNSSGFTFNAPKPEAAAFGQPAVPTPIFGTPQSTTQNQSTPAFSATPSANTGFNFGSTAPATSSGGFNFGGMPSAPATSGGFNFNPPAATPTFDPNTRPSFNFTGGGAPPTFTAPPQSSSVQRKFKKAIRRMR